MKPIIPISEPSRTGAILSLIAAPAFLFAGIVFLRIGIIPAAVVLLLLSAMSLVISLYCFRNAPSKKRTADSDATAPSEGQGPQYKRYPMSHYKIRKGYCPYCGEAIKAGIGEGFVYCANCGRKL